MGFRKGRRSRILLAVLAVVVIWRVHSWHSSLNRQFQGSLAFLPTTSHLKDVHLSDPVQPGDDLRARLSKLVPYRSQEGIPRMVWQTWKCTPNSREFPDSYRNPQAAWSNVYESQNFDYELVPDDSMLPMLESLYAPVPDIIEAFKMLPTKILQADFFRYLVMFARGGIYSDLDTIPLKDLSSWPSLDPKALREMRLIDNLIDYKGSESGPSLSTKLKMKLASKLQGSLEPGLVIGIEADPDREDWNEWYARRIQFCQWTIQAKPGHPVLRELILNITATTFNSVKDLPAHLKHYRELVDKENVNDYNINLRDKKGSSETRKNKALKVADNVDGTDIMNWTGPGIFTDIIFEYLNNILHTRNDVLIFNPNLIDNGDQMNIEKSTLLFRDRIIEALRNYGQITWEFFGFITKPVLVDDVLILPITSFSPGVEQMESKGLDDEMALVQHIFGGTWKDDLPDTDK